MKLLSELTDEELKALYEKSDFLKAQARQWADEEFDFKISEVMGYFRKINGMEWNLGYPGNYISVKEKAYKEFISACLNLNRDYIIFCEEDINKLERAEKKAEFFYDAMLGYYDISDARFENLERWLKDIVDTAIDDIISYYRSEENYYFTDECRDECFWDVWLGNNEENYQTDGQYIYEVDLRRYS